MAHAIDRWSVTCCATLLLAGSLLALESRASATADRRMSRAELEDRIRGGWAGQMIGVAYGAPTEFRAQGRINEAKLEWAPDNVENAIHQDDLYVEMTFADLLDRVGLEATAEQFGNALRDSKYWLWHANASARRNLARGIKAPMSGHPRYNVHANDIDFQIESDFIGLMTPGLPRAANRIADRVGHVMNYGDGVYGGMFFAGMYAAAFFETSPRRVVEQGLESIPAKSGYARVISDVLAWHVQDPSDWRRTWQRLEAKWNRDAACADGALSAFNIDARLNGAYVTLGLLYGEGDMGRTMEIAIRAGQDSDCNPSSAAGILGVMLGWSQIPDAWKSGILPLADTRFEYTRYSLNDIVASTSARALKVIAASGGRVTDREVVIPYQAPRAARWEQWDSGVPVRKLAVDAPGWTWTGGWTVVPHENEWTKWNTKRAMGAGDAVTLVFDGTGVALLGTLGQDGGRADVTVDGKAAGVLDAWIPEHTVDTDLFHVMGLRPGRHTVRVVVRGDADLRSEGTRIEIDRAVVYEKGSRSRP